mgnify:CR=1 FL=1
MIYIAVLTGLVVGLIFYCSNKAERPHAAQLPGPPGPGLGVAEAAANVRRNTFRVFAIFLGRLAESHIRCRLAVQTAAVLLAYTGGALVYAFLTRDTAFWAGYWAALPGLLGVDLGLTWICCLASASRRLLWLALGLSLLGSLMQLSNGAAAKALVFYHLAALVGAGLFLLFISWMKQISAKAMVAVTLVITTGLYVYTALFGFAPEGTRTKVWVHLGGVSIQISEITKLLAILAAALLLANNLLSERKKLLGMAVVFALNAGCLVMLHELSTVIVLAISYGLAALLGLRDIKLLAKAGAAAFGLAALLYWLGSMKVSGVLNDAYEKLHIRLGGVTQVEPNSQLGKALQEFHLVRWLGSCGFQSAVPVGGSDFVIIRMVMELGMASLVAAVIAYLALLCYSLKMPSPIWGIAIAAQSLLAIASAAGFIATVGLGPVLLGEGGSTYLIAWCMLAALLADSTQIILTPRRKTAGRRKGVMNHG